MLKTFIIICLATISLAHSAAQAKCDAGYYLDAGNNCVACSRFEGYYCQDGVSRTPCPDYDRDMIAAQIGCTPRGNAYLYAWGNVNAAPTDEKHCVLASSYSCPQGVRYMESYYSGPNYNFHTIYWQSANPGYYLSGPHNDTLFYNVVACTNAPQTNAHYTSQPLLQENNCPWECDSGYGRHNSQCLLLCDASATELHAGSNVYNMYTDKQTEHAIVIQIGNKKCYVNLESGTGKLNINLNGTIYHATD